MPPVQPLRATIPRASRGRWTKEPGDSTAFLSINGALAHFTADVAGEFKVRVRATHPAGDFAETTYVFDAFAPPAAVLVAQSGTANSGNFSAYKGYQIVLDGSQSTGPAGDVLTKQWALTSKPASSTAQLSAQIGNFSNFVPDQAGDVRPLRFPYWIRIRECRSTGSDWSGVQQALLGRLERQRHPVRSQRPSHHRRERLGRRRPVEQHGLRLRASETSRARRSPTGASSDDLKAGTARYLNPAAFVANTTPGTHGKLGRRLSPADRRSNNLDAGLDKNFQLGGSRYLTIRIEAFNVLNHTNLGLPPAWTSVR